MSYLRETLLKVICIQDFYYNLTKPYFKFIEGEVYDVIVYEDGIAYRFSLCDAIMTEKDFFKYFETISEHRNKKIQQLGI